MTVVKSQSVPGDVLNTFATHFVVVQYILIQRVMPDTVELPIRDPIQSLYKGHLLQHHANTLVYYLPLR